MVQSPCGHYKYCVNAQWQLTQDVGHFSCFISYVTVIFYSFSFCHFLSTDYAEEKVERKATAMAAEEGGREGRGGGRGGGCPQAYTVDYSLINKAQLISWHLICPSH